MGANNEPEIVASVGANVRAIRESLGISIRELARRSGLSYTAIWKVEAGRMAPTIIVLHKIARGLGKKVAQLLGDNIQEEDIVYTPTQSRTRVRMGTDNFTMETMSASSEGWVIEAGEFIAHTGAKSGREPMAHRGEEFSYCVEGQLQYTINGKSYELKPGDAIHFKSHLPHSWKNTSRGRSRFFFVVVPPRGSGRSSV